MSSLCDDIRDKFFASLKASIRVAPRDKFSYESLVNLWGQIEKDEKKKAKENQEANIKLMEEGYRKQPELITGEEIDCLVQCPNCGKKIGEVIDGTINPEIVKKMFVRDDD